MTFGPQHYVPVLKVKRGEKKALGAIGGDLSSQITPLLEFVVRRNDKKPTVRAHLDTAFVELSESLRAYPRCFLDVRELSEDGPTAAEAVFRMAVDEGIAFTPVTGISRQADVDAALACRTRGLALRLTRKELEQGNLTQALRTFVGNRKIVLEETDLIMDIGPVEDLIAEGIAGLTLAFMNAVPDHRRWRTFTVSGSAFPRSMGMVGRNSFAQVERAEWIAWRDSLHARRGELIRLPTFSDCAIQHPLGVEGFDPLKMQVSASVRYAESDNWLLLKGESTKKVPAKTQFPKLGAELVTGDQRQHFLGPNHCSGCSSIVAAANGASGFGSAESWRRIGTIHHITTVVQGIGELIWT